MTTQAKLAALVAAAEKYLVADDAVYASMHQGGDRAPDHSERCMRRYNARIALREMVLDLNAEAADRKMGGSLSPKTDAVIKAAAAKGIAFRNLKNALEMDPADTRGLPTLKEKGE